MVTLDIVRDGIKEIVREVINYLREGRASGKVVGRGPSGDVTKDFDIVSEEIIVNGLRKLFSDDVVIVSEELGVNIVRSDAKWVAIIDPVDGSTNYDAGIPWVAVSIGIAKRRSSERTKISDEVLAVVADVFRGRIYEFYNGQVYLNSSLIRRSKKPKNVVFGYFEKPEAYFIIPAYWTIRGSRAALRSLGSVALEIIYVGLGRAEALVDLRAKIRNVDVAAAYRIAMTLGSKAVLCDGSPLENFPIDDLLSVKCLLMGYDDETLKKLLKAYETIY